MSEIKECGCAKGCKCKGINSPNKDKELVIGTLKQAIKELIKQALEETSVAATGSGGYMSKYFGGKVKNPTAGVPGYTKVGNSNTGTLDETGEKKSSKTPVPFKAAVKKKTMDIVPDGEVNKKDAVIASRRAAGATNPEDKKFYTRVANTINKKYRVAAPKAPAQKKK